MALLEVVPGAWQEEEASILGPLCVGAYRSRSYSILPALFEPHLPGRIVEFCRPEMMTILHTWAAARKLSPSLLFGMTDFLVLYYSTPSKDAYAMAGGMSVLLLPSGYLGTG